MAPRTQLLLSPGVSLAQPRGWISLASQPSVYSKTVPFSQRQTTVDEVHCVGGGSLLLWLLACAGRAPRGRVVYMHGPVVLPTPESCGEWLMREHGAEASDGYLLSSHDWRQQAVACGVGGGGLPPEHFEWLRPLLTAIACGRAHELGERFSSMQRRWERIGRLVHVPMPRAEDDLIGELLGQNGVPAVKQEAPPTLLRCGQMGCVLAAPLTFAAAPPCARTEDTVFLCPPVGWQHVNMGRACFEENAVFAGVLRECEALAARHGQLPRPLLEVLYPTPETEAECAMLLQTPTFTMPALFAVEYGLVAMCEGCEPYAVIGHSIGEYVAAVVAGVLDLPTAMALVCERGRAMDDCPLAGSMVSLMADVPTVLEAIAATGVGEHVSIAAINGLRSVVIGGEDDQLAKVLKNLPDGTKSRRVRTTHPDHTSLMAPIADAVGRRAAELLALRPSSSARCLWVSSVASWQARDQSQMGQPKYWREGIVAGVDFPRAVEAVVRDFAASTASSAGGDGGASTRRTLRFVEMGEGMLTRFCGDVPCLSDADRDESMQFETAFVHLLPRKERADKAAQAREIEGVIEEVKRASRSRPVVEAQPAVV